MVDVNTQLDSLDFTGGDGERYHLSLGHNGSGEVLSIRVQKQKMEQTDLGEYWTGCEEPMIIKIPDLPYSQRKGVKEQIEAL